MECDLSDLLINDARVRGLLTAEEAKKAPCKVAKADQWKRGEEEEGVKRRGRVG